MKLLVAERLGAKTEEALEIAAVEEGRSPPDDFWRVAFKLDIGAHSEADTPEEDAAAASKDSRSAGWEDAPSLASESLLMRLKQRGTVKYGRIRCSLISNGLIFHAPSRRRYRNKSKRIPRL